MGTRSEDFFHSLFSKESKRSDELLFSARALVAQMKEELLAGLEGPTAGVPAGINVNKQPRNFGTPLAVKIGRNGQKRTTPNTKVSSTTEP